MLQNAYVGIPNAVAD